MHAIWPANAVLTKLSCCLLKDNVPSFGLKKDSVDNLVKLCMIWDENGALSMLLSPGIEYLRSVFYLLRVDVYVFKVLSSIREEVTQQDGQDCSPRIRKNSRRTLLEISQNSNLYNK